MYEKYIKYKLKYINLKTEIQQKKDEIDKLDPSTFTYIKNDFKKQIDPMFCNALVQFINICFILFREYPPVTTTYIFLGQSPIIINIIAEIIAQYRRIDFKYRGLPISGADALLDLTSEGYTNIYNYFDTFDLNTIVGNCIIVDYVNTGTSLSQIAELLDRYIIEKQIDATLTAVGLSSSGTQLETKYPIKILNLKPPIDTPEADAGMRLLIAKSYFSFLNNIRLYNKQELKDIISGNLHQEETTTINEWLGEYLEKIIIIVKSILDDDDDVCNKIEIDKTTEKKRNPFLSFNMFEIRLKEKLTAGTITIEKYKEQIEAKLKTLLASERINQIEYDSKIKELL
jgi:hypothetical protein